MVVLGIDPGAIRMGYACLEREDSGITVIGSGVLGLQREAGEPYQQYKLRLIEYWIGKGAWLLDKFKPDEIICEIVPAVGGGNFVVAAQSHLASTCATVLITLAKQKQIPVTQVSANTVKRQIGGKANASKAKVRKGVYKLMPNLEEREEWKQVSDESDAYAIALWGLDNG